MPETAKLKTKIEDTKDRLISLLQVYCTSQVALWHRVPELAKTADKLNRFTIGRYKMAHDCYLWPISPRFWTGLQVDLRTGEIRSGSDGFSLDTIELGQISLILKQLDAAEVIKFLQDVIMSLSPKLGHELKGANEV